MRWLTNKNGEADIVDGTDVVGKNISYGVEKNRYNGFEPAVEKNKGDIQITADGQAVRIFTVTERHIQ